MSCLFISHDLALVRGLCSRVYVMKDGVVVEQGETKQLFEHPQDPYTVELLSCVLDFRKKTER
jgi:ABC-type dipeptide/oligopeptide/nickel transport system ATPase component